MLPRPVPFPYYAKLSRKDKAIYRKSDAITGIEVPDPEALRPLAAQVDEALRAEDRRILQKATAGLANTILESLGVERVTLRVLAVRPSNADSELHGLYEHEEGKRAVIRVWMRTATKGQVVKFRTFLRTMLHELCHHLDYLHLGLADSFHTEGFFRRESSLMRQLAPKPAATKEPANKGLEKAAKTRSKPKPKPKRQLELPFG
jgi:hypothetical protein